MSKTITIEPITKIEGEAKVTIQLDDKGNVSDARFHVLDFRGFEKFVEGRMFWELPVITPRICGICPVSHHLASVKACDDILKVDIPAPAKKLRELMHMGQYIHSHSLHFFHLAAADLLFGPDSDPMQRNIIGIIQANPDLAKEVIKLRKYGQKVIELTGGRPIHPVTAIPGGMSKPLTHEERYVLLKEIDSIIKFSLRTVEIAKEINEKYKDIIPEFGLTSKTKHMGLVKNGSLELYDGNLRMIDPDGNILSEFEPRNYLDYIGEHIEDYSYAKFPFYKPHGYPDGIYRVAPLSRLNVAERIDTELANKELQEFKKLNNGKPVQETFYYHYARVIEILYAAERAKQLLEDDDIINNNVRVKVDRCAGTGVGVVEAPRGTLFHHYEVDDIGRILKANIIVATGQNNPAMNLSVKEIAKKYIKDGKFTEGILNRIEMGIRAYDPCLTCTTHAIGKMPLEIKLLDSKGTCIDIIKREEEF